MALRQLASRLTWALFKQKTIGIDKHGNKYYIVMDKTMEGEPFERRMVKFPSDRDMFDPLPPEWNAWLRKTRDVAPSEDDMEKGEAERQAQRERAEAADAEAAEAAMRWTQGGRGQESSQQLHAEGPPRRSNGE